MADFGNSLKKVFPSPGESRVLLGWGLATALLIVLEYVVFSVASGTGVSSGRLPVVRILLLGAGAYVVLMIRDIIAYYAGVTVDEMFSLSPVVVFGILAFMIGFLLYAIHDIQNVGATMAQSSKKTGGNILSLFFDDSPEGFEDSEPEVEQPKTQPAKQASPPPRMPVQDPPATTAPAIGMNHYGPETNPFSQTRSESTRNGESHSQDIRDMEKVSNTLAEQTPVSLDEGSMMGGGGNTGGLGYSTF